MPATTSEGLSGIAAAINLVGQHLATACLVADRQQHIMPNPPRCSMHCMLQARVSMATACM
jgi:hypothetical protein